MNKKFIYCTFILTSLLLSGCTQKNNQTPNNNSSAAESTAPSASADALGSTVSSTDAYDNNAHTTDTAQSTAAPQNNTTHNNGDTTTMITEERAKEIALTHAGLTADQVTFVKSGLDRDDGHEHYDIEFYNHDNMEYDYEIDPYTGEVLDYDYDAEYYDQASDTQTKDKISEEEAKRIALDKVPGATDEDIREFHSDYDNSKFKYEGKIYYGQKEYEFEIDGHSGDILEWDVETIHTKTK